MKYRGHFEIRIKGAHVITVFKIWNPKDDIFEHLCKGQIKDITAIVFLACGWGESWRPRLIFKVGWVRDACSIKTRGYTPGHWSAVVLDPTVEFRN